MLPRRVRREHRGLNAKEMTFVVNVPQEQSKGCENDIASRRGALANVLFCGGRVGNIANDADAKALTAMLMIGGEAVKSQEAKVSR